MHTFKCIYFYYACKRNCLKIQLTLGMISLVIGYVIGKKKKKRYKQYTYIYIYFETLLQRHRK